MFIIISVLLTGCGGKQKEIPYPAGYYVPKPEETETAGKSDKSQKNTSETVKETTRETMMNIEKMRKMAFHYKNQYFTTSVMLTVLIAVIALICMLVGIWFVGIPALYCISSVVTMCIVGNLVLYLLMRFIGLPDQITEG